MGLIMTAGFRQKVPDGTDSIIYHAGTGPACLPPDTDTRGPVGHVMRQQRGTLVPAVQGCRVPAWRLKKEERHDQNIQ